MTSVDPSQQDGIIPEAEANANDNPNASEDPNAEGDATHGEGGKGVKKILTQRNDARQEANEWKKKYENVVNGVVDQKLAKRDKTAQMENLKVNFGEEALEKTEAVLEKYPDLSVEDAFKIASPQDFASMGQSFNIQGTTPSNAMREKSLDQLSPEELRSRAEKEFNASM